jgi:hypothetical protein
MIRRARVVKVHPERRTLDCIDLDTGIPYAGVDILSLSMSSDSGLWSVPSVPRPSSHQSSMGIQDTGRIMVANLLPAGGGRMVCIGFSHMAGATGALTARDDELIYRHPSGTTITVEPNGTTIMALPGGVVHRLNIDGTAHLTAPSKVTIDSPLVDMTGELQVAKAVRMGATLDVVENMTTQADTVSSGKSFLQHTHKENDNGANTNPPN